MMNILDEIKMDVKFGESEVIVLEEKKDNYDNYG